MLLLFIILQLPRFTLTDNSFPYPTLFRSEDDVAFVVGVEEILGLALVLALKKIENGSFQGVDPIPFVERKLVFEIVEFVSDLVDYGLDFAHSLVIPVAAGAVTEPEMRGDGAMGRPIRSETRRVGNECVSRGRSRWSTYN